MAFLASHPDIRRQLRVNIHMDMVGGDPFKNKSVFHVTATPWSLPSFVTDVGAEFLSVIESAASGYASGEITGEDGIVETRASGSGTRNGLIADVTPYSSGSDHDDFDSSTIAVPSLYLRDWPDIYIHTDHDTLEQIDATKLRRVALLGAASGYVYATLDKQRIALLVPFVLAQSESRLGHFFAEAQKLLADAQLEPGIAWYESRNLLHEALMREIANLNSLIVFTGGAAPDASEAIRALTEQQAAQQAALDKQANARGATGKIPKSPWAASNDAKRIPARVGEFGPLTYQNDNVLLARLGKDRYGRIKLINSEATQLLNVRDQSELYAYEIINFVDGKRSVGEIRDAVSAEYGPLPLNLVTDYLDACAEAQVIQWNQNFAPN
jgi:hypothetical protein